MVDKNPISIKTVNRDGCTLSVNLDHTQLFKSVPPNNLSIFDYLVKNVPALEEIILRAKSGEAVYFPELPFNARNVSPDYPDEPVWVRTLIFPLNDGPRSARAFMSVTQDQPGRGQIQRQSLQRGYQQHSRERGKLQRMLNEQADHQNQDRQSDRQCQGHVQQPGRHWQDQDHHDRVV